MYLVFIICCVSTVTAKYANLYMYNSHITQSSIVASNTNVKEKYFEQIIDHFHTNTLETFQQRYFYNDEFFQPGGPLFIYICGEGECDAWDASEGEIVEQAKIHNALIVALEHRYYGRSTPTPDWSTDNLKWLSSLQAQEDLAVFAEFITKENGIMKGNAIIWGGSYSGAMSAWFRSLHPSLVTGSVASSGPVHAKLEFYEYDQAVSEAAGNECSADIIKATVEVEKALLTDPHTVMSSFSCNHVNDQVSFLYVLADAVSFAIQYSSDVQTSKTYHLREFLCDTFKAHRTDPYTGYKVFMNTFLSEKMNTTCLAFDSNDLTSLRNITIDHSSGQRQWFWQSCLEFGYFQVAPSTHSLRSSRIDLQYHLDLCAKTFDIAGMHPDVEGTNARYGSLKIHGSRIALPNGSTDPWAKLGVTKATKETFNNFQFPRVINGTSHCTDLHSSTPTDSEDLKEARKEIGSLVSLWLSTQSQRCPPSFTLCNNYCVDVETDVENCGNCGVSINIHETCIKGQIEQVSKYFSTNNAATIVLSILLGLTIVFVIFLVLKVRSLKATHATATSYSSVA